MLKTILGIILFFILTYAVPFVLGSSFIAKREEVRPTDAYLSYVMGMLVMLSIFEVLSVTFTLLHLSFSLLCYIYTAVLVVLALLQLRGGFFSLWQNRSRWGLLAEPRPTPERRLVVGAVLVLLFVETFLLVWFQSSHFGDNYFHTAAMTDAIERDTMWAVDPANGWNEYVNVRYKLGGWDMFLAYLAKMSGMPATLLCYTLLPLFAYPWFYMVAALIGYAIVEPRHLNKDAVFADYFVLFFGVLLLFGYNAMVSAPGYFANMPWAGRSILYGICAFLMFAMMLTQFKGKTGDASLREEMSLGSQGMWEIFLLNFASLSLSLTGMLTLLPIEVGIYLLYCIRSRRLFSLGRVLFTLLPFVLGALFYAGEYLITLLYYIQLWL